MAGITDQELRLIDLYWRAANYLSVGQIYLYENPLLKEHFNILSQDYWGTGEPHPG
jgi:xylulose-5-phosphate/fructose-6-phosphate phosphoketolase